MKCPPCNHNCHQSDMCPARTAKQIADDIGEPFIGSGYDFFLAVILLVFVASCIGYVWGGWR